MANTASTAPGVELPLRYAAWKSIFPTHLAVAKNEAKISSLLLKAFNAFLKNARTVTLLDTAEVRQKLCVRVRADWKKCKGFARMGFLNTDRQVQFAVKHLVR